MFGGLEVKSPPEKKKEEAAPAPAPASSAFSFMSSAPAPAAASSEPAAPASSGFSFLNRVSSQDSQDKSTASANPPPAAATAAAAPTGSAFSFLGPAKSQDESDAPAASAPPPAPVPEATVPEESAAPPPAAAASSGFAFLSSNTSADTVSTMSRDSPATLGPTTTEPAPAPADLLGAIPSSQLPAGSGVVFGGAGASPGMAMHKKHIKKKRTRAAKVGVAAHAQTTPAVSLPPPVVPQQPPEPAPEEPASTREAAEQAAQRAEEFLQEKTMATTIPASESTDSEDILAAAKAAAEEAQHMTQQRSNSSSSGLGIVGGALGGLFRRNASPPNTAASSLSHHSPAGASGATRKTSAAASSATEAMTPLERLQKEQEEVKRAMDQRQLEMMQQQKQTEDTSNSTDPPNLAASSSEPMSLPSYGPPKNLVAVVPVPQPPSWNKAQSSQQQVSVPKPKTALDVFHDMMKAFSSQIVDSMTKVAQLRQQRSMLLEERFVAVAKERLATQAMAAAETQQMAAAEDEDFELADQLGTIMEGHERERAELVAILENIGRALQQLDSQKKEMVQGVTKCFVDFQSKLKKYQEEQESKDTKDATESLKRFEVVSKQLSAENERLEQDLKHLEKDAALVADERKEVEGVISEQAGEFERLRDEARESLKSVEEEIEELRKQLAAKQKEAADLRTAAAGHDEAVLRVRVKFSRQLTRVQKKEMAIEDSREEWAVEKKSYETHKAEHDAEVSAHSDALLARDKLLEALNREIEMADTFEAIVSKEVGFEGTSDEENESDDDVAHLQADVVKSEAAVNEAKEVLNVATKAVTDLDEETKSLEFQIPQLEEIKKSAAARRDFKGAGKASKEIKEAVARLKECQDEVSPEAHRKKAAAEIEVEKLEAVLGEKRKTANEKEKVSGLVTMQRLADNIKRLAATRDSVCGDAEENTIQGVGAFVLNTQIKALSLEGKTLGDKFGGWEELVGELGLESSGDAEADKSGVEADAAETAGAIKPAPSADAADSGPPESEESKAAKRQVFRKLTQRLKDAEENLEAAVAKEDYEEAAEIDEILQQIMAELSAIDLTDEEMDAALLEEDAPVEDDVADKGDTEEATSPPKDDKLSDEDVLDDPEPEEETPSDPTSVEDEPEEEATPDPSPVEGDAEGETASDPTPVEADGQTMDSIDGDEPVVEEATDNAYGENGEATKDQDASGDAINGGHDAVVETQQDDNQISDDDL